MTTKNYCLFFKDKQDQVGNDKLNGQFNNLNLNQNNQCFAEIVQSSKNTENHKISNYDYSSHHNDFSQTKQNSTLFGKTKLGFSFTNLNAHKNYDKKEEKILNANKSSTLSLHIFAYENSINASFGDQNDWSEKDRIHKNSINSLKVVKELFNGSASSVNYAFELPRQQQQNQNNDPEVMQFKASQRLSNVNGARSSSPPNCSSSKNSNNNNMSSLNLIFDLTVTDIVPHMRKSPKELKEDLQRYFKEIGLSTCYFNSLSSFNRCITLAAEPAVPQKDKCLGISDTAEAHLEISAQEITKKAAIVAKQSTRNASSGIIGGKTMGFEYAQQLQRGLCFIKRMRRENKNESMESKTVIINFSPDLSEQTTELMTLFFTYQTFHEKIDILDISGEVNPTLQQGCDITGGRYVALAKFPTSLLGCISRNFFISSSSLNFFPTVIEREVDYRFPCRCHNTLVDLGYICASCLSVHCRPATKCVACGANFMPNVSIDELIERQPTPPPPKKKRGQGHGMSLRTRRDLNISSEKRVAIFPIKKAKKEEKGNGQSEA